MRPREIAALLDERFRLLTGGRRTAVERHQTLRATVDWSYSLLDERERHVFDRLGVFAGSFDARGRGSGRRRRRRSRRGTSLDALAELVAKSMVVADDDADGDDALPARRRYSLGQVDRLIAEPDIQSLDSIG